LDDLDTNVEDATVGLREESKHADEVRKKANNCYLYVCVLVEIVVLAILVVVYTTSGKK